MILSIFLFLTNSVSYANSWETSSEEKIQTIKEIKESLSNLDKESILIDEKKDDLNKDLELLSFFKENLGNEDLQKIKKLITIFKEDTKKIEYELKEKIVNSEETEEIKNNIIELRKNFFKNLITYIDINKIDSYLEYIKEDSIIIKEKENIEEWILKNKLNLENRINLIKEKIEEHKKEIDLRIDKVVKEKLDEKINNLLNSDNFIKLDYEKKIEILDKIIEKINEKIYDINLNWFVTNISKKKIEIYNITIEKITEAKSGVMNID